MNWLYDRQEELKINPFKQRHFMTPDDLEALWRRNQEDVLGWFTENAPCTRPGPWWEYDAPKELVAGCDGSEFFAHQAFRRRLGGTGTPSHEVLAYVPHFQLGIPTEWVSSWQAEYYNGRAVDINGVKIGAGYKSGRFKGVAIDPDDPPLFESQAAYLQRHDLLTKEEAAYLAKHPELLEPEPHLADHNPPSEEK